MWGGEGLTGAPGSAGLLPSPLPSPVPAGRRSPDCHVGGMAPPSTRALTCLSWLNPMVPRGLRSCQTQKGQA